MSTTQVHDTAESESEENVSPEEVLFWEQLQALINNSSSQSGKCYISRDTIAPLFEVLEQWIPNVKFSKWKDLMEEMRRKCQGGKKVFEGIDQAGRVFLKAKRMEATRKVQA